MASLARTVPILARTVPSLARTVPSLARTVLKPSVLPQRGTRRQRQLVVRMVVDGGGWDTDAHTFFLCSYLENYLIIIHNFFWNF